MKSRLAKNSTHENNNVSWTSFVTPCVSLSFVLAVGPAQANRGDDFDRNLLRQMRLEQRALRQQVEPRNSRIQQIAPQLDQVIRTRDVVQPRINNVQLHRNEATLRNNARTWQTLDSGRVRNTNSQVELNLGSGSRSIVLGANIFDQGGRSVTVTVGGGEKTFGVGSKVTAAEYASILQVLGGGSQSLQLDNQGRAAGGSLALDSLTNGDSMRVSGLVVPEAVQVVGNFGGRSDFNLTGDLVNNGAIVALSNRAGANKASISANNLFNSASGSISSVVNPSDFPQYGQLETSVDLKLRGQEALTNQGSISSSGDLTLAGNTVSNESTRHSTATISAQNNVYIESGSLNNTGSISAVQGNVGILSPVNGSIAINNAGGTISALNGSITVGDAANVAKIDTTLTGGDWLSQSLNLYSGDGALRATVGEVTGTVNASAGTANIKADTENLLLGTIATSGDPTFTSTGNLTVQALIETDGNPLALLARGNITFQPDAIIDTSSGTGDGGDIIMVAGSDWSAQGANNRITGGSAGGGSIDATANAIEIYTDGADNAGNITMIAFQGNSANSGRIILDSAVVSALGGSGFDNGNITIIGGGGVLVESVDALGVGSNAGTGNILISSFNPVVVNGPVLINDSTGALVQGGFAPNSLPTNRFDVTITDSVFAGGNVSIQSAAATSVSAVDAGSLSITALGNIDLIDDIFATSGIVIVGGRDIKTQPPGALIDLITDGGNVYVVAGASFTQTASDIVIAGASATGGGIDFETVSLRQLDTTSTAPNGSGGDVELIAYDGSDNLTGYIITNGTDTDITTGGNGTGSNGDFTAIAGNNDFDFGLGIRGSVNTSGGSTAGTGDVYIANAAPLGGVTITKASADRTVGTFKGGAIQPNSRMQLDDIQVGAGASIDIITGGDTLIVGEIIGGVGSTASLRSNGFASLNDTVNVGKFTLTATDFISIFGDVFARDGMLIVAGRSIASDTPTFLTMSTASASGDAGNMTIVAGAAFTQDDTTVTITGASSTGGAIFLVTGPTLNIDASSANGDGGDITMVAFEGAATDFGKILFDNATNLDASGGGGGANGNVIMVAGDTSGTSAIELQGDIVLNGAPGTGTLSFSASTPNTPVTLSKDTSGVSSGDFRGGPLNDSDILLASLTVSGGTIEVLTGGSISASNLSTAAGAVGNGGIIRVRSGSTDTLDIGGAVNTNYIGSVNSAAGTISGNAGTIDIQSDGTGGIDLEQLGSLVPTDGNGGTLRLAAPNGLILNTGSFSFDVDAATTSATARNGGSLTLDSQNVTNTAISVSGAGVAGGTGGNLSLTNRGADLSVGPLANEAEIQNNFANVTLVTQGSGNEITITAGGSFSSSASIFINSGAAVTLNGGLTSPVITIIGNPIVVNAPLSGSTSVDLTTNIMTNNNVITGGSINVNSTTGSGLVFGGAGGTWNATTGQTTVTTTGNSMLLGGTQTFNGDVEFNAVAMPGAFITLLNTAVYTGNDAVTVNTYTFNELGTLIGNPKTINTTFYTIANSAGNVVLTGDLIYTGQNLAIFAAGDILASGITTIDLSAAGNAGSLTMVAGFNFTPTTGSQTSTGITLTLTDESTIGGDIDLGNVTINLSSGTGLAGKLNVVASGGTTNSGSIALGSIDLSSGTGSGNEVLIVGEGGVSLGAIDTTGTTGDGQVLIAVAQPIVSGTVNATNGTIGGGGFFQVGTSTAGDLALNGISADLAQVFLIGALNSTDSITTASFTGISAGFFPIIQGAGTVTLNGTVNALSINGTGDGTLNYIQSGRDLSVAGIPGSNMTISISSDDDVNIATGAIAVNSLSVTADTIGIINTISASNDLILTATTGDFVISNNLTATAGDLVITSQAGDLTIAAAATLNGAFVTLEAFDAISVAGNVTTNSLSLTSGADIQMSSITGTISPLDMLFLESVNGAIGTIATPFTSTAGQVYLEAGGGSVFFNSTNTAGVELVRGDAFGEFNFTAAGPLTILDHVTTTGGIDGDINITQTGPGTLTIGENVTITSDEGDIRILNQDINKKTGFIVIEDGVTIKGSGTTGDVGEVFITLGPVPTELKFKKPPKNVTINTLGGANVFIGKKGLNVKKQENIVLQALNRNLIFNTDKKQNKKNLSLGSNVTITADPPGDVFVREPRRVAAGAAQALGVAAPAQVELNASAEVAPLVADFGAFGNLAVNAGLSAPTSTVLATETNNVIGAPLTSLVMSEAANASETRGAASSAVRVVSDVLPGAIDGAGLKVVCDGETALAGSHELGAGSAVYAPSKDMVVNTPHAKVSIAQNSLVLVVSGAHGTSVYDLHDGKREAVKVSFGGKQVSLSPGRHATVCSRSANSYTTVNPVESILHRDVDQVATASGAAAFTSEFAIHSAVQSVGALDAIVKSSHPECAKLSGKLLKTAAVLMHISGSREPFQHYLNPRLTASR